MSSEECPGTLLLRSQRVVLSQSESVSLEAHLERCASCRLLEVVLRDFDAAAVSDRHDAARIERLASFARQKTIEENRSRVHVLGARRPSLGLGRGKVAHVLMAAAAILLMVAGASAAIYVHDAGDPPEAIALQTSELGLPTLENARKTIRSAAREVVRERAATVNSLEPVGPLREPACTAGVCRDAAEPFNAAELFKQASLARRAGRTSEATELYRELQRRHSGSAEAKLSHVSLGHLLLSDGRAALALKQFDQALRSGSGMRAETLYGKALSLAQLGRSTEERATWRRLLEDFPESPYAVQARRRLGESG